MRYLTRTRLCLVAAAALGGCSMANSLQIPDSGERGCHSDLGAYFLPRDYLHVEVRNTNPVTPKANSVDAAARRAAPRYEIALIETRTKADRTRGFCLDYLGSRTSNDYLEVGREEGLLIRVGTTNRSYADLSKDELPSALGPGDSEDVTSRALADELIRKGLPDKVAALSEVTYPWAGRPGTQGADPKQDPDKDPKLALFCKDPNASKDPLFNQFCSGNEPIDAQNPEAERRFKAYYTARLNSSLKRAEPSGGDGGASSGRQLSRVVYRNDFIGKIDKAGTAVGPAYVPSGGYRGVDDYKTVAELDAGAAAADAATRYGIESQAANLKKLARPHPDSKNRLEAPFLWQTDTIFTSDYDAASPAQAAINNSGLRDFGLCLLLNDGQVDPAKRDEYCEDPVGYGQRQGWRMHTGERFEGYVNYAEGLLYRPRLNYTLWVFRKKQLGIRGGWQLDSQHLVSLPNIAPMISVGVKRTVFASRNTVVEFDRGALINIAVRKDSELNNALDVPLSLVQRLSALPTNIVQIRIRNTDAAKQLAEKQKELLEAEISYNRTLIELQKARTGAAETTASPNQ